MSFTPAQQSKYRPLVARAWIEECKRSGQSPNNKPARETWYRAQLLESVGVQSTAKCDKVKDFDKVMLHFAIMAGDEYWINRLSDAAERRMKHQIREFMRDLAYLEKRDIGWDYIKAIHAQSARSNTQTRRPKQASVPENLDECPVYVLWKILQMLDTHIRRICADYRIRPMVLPSRSHPPQHPITINPDNHHLTVGHDLDRQHHDQQTMLPF